MHTTNFHTMPVLDMSPHIVRDSTMVGLPTGIAKLHLLQRVTPKRVRSITIVVRVDIFNG